MSTRRKRTAIVPLLALILASGAHANDDIDIFGDMLKEKALEGSDSEFLSPQAAQDFAAILNTPGLLNNDRSENNQESNTLMDIGGKHCLAEAVLLRTKMVGRAQAEKDIAKWKALLDKGELTEMGFWQKAVECKDYCAKVLVDTVDCYQNEASKRFRGIFLFDTGVGRYQEVTKGDRASQFKTHNNERVMKQVVATLKANPKDHIMLEGRASRTGNDEVNFRLSGTRSDSIQAELVRRGVPSSRIHYRWLGEGEPYYRREMAQKYQITDKFDAFGGQTLNQSVTVYIYQPAGG